MMCCATLQAKLLFLWNRTPLPDHRFLAVVAGLCALSLNGCDKGSPKGQVIAVVDGEEITISELNYEARIRNLRLENDPALRRALLKELVDRKLLVREAGQRAIEKTPDFILAERRAREILLAQSLLADRSGAASVSAADVRKFIADHPLAFGERVTASADLLEFASASPALRQQLGSARSLEAMIAILRAASVKFRRSGEVWDSADTSSPLGQGRIAPREGQPFVLERGGGTIAGMLTEVTPQPVPEAQKEEFARSLIDRASSSRQMELSLEQASKQAVVRYQAGFAP
jgi:EpsD family peptidyl-prolyl cis-trans isomerase